MNELLDIQSTFWDLVEARAADTPDRCFLRDDNGASLTFSEYKTAAESLAAGLFDLGVRPRQTVSWQLPTSISAALLLGALSRLTAIQNPIIHILRRSEVGFIVDELDSDWLITPGLWKGFDFAKMANEVASESGVATLAFDAEPPAGDAGTLESFAGLRTTVAGGSTDWIYYSSGSTGRPKGARHTDVSAMNGSNGFIFNLGVCSSDIFPMAYPITHIGGISYMTATLRTGSVLVTLDTFDPAISPIAMSECDATLLGSALPFFNAYLAAQDQSEAPLYPNLRVCKTGGAPSPPELHDMVRDKLGGAGVLNGWGLTEFPVATFTCVGDPDDWHRHTVGSAAPGVSVRVVSLDGVECSTGTEGELRLKGPQMLAGYVDTRLDAEGFDTEGWFRTGDLGFVDENANVHVTGRLKDIIIRNAENISATEVENVLYSHPGVEDVAVVGLPDAKTGERACAVIQLSEGAAAPTLASIGQHCRAKGLANQKIPEQLEIVETMPRHPQGKILKHEIRAMLLGDT